MVRQNHFFFRFDKNQCGVKGLGTCNTLKKKKENKKICKLYILSTDIWLYILQISFTSFSQKWPKFSAMFHTSKKSGK